MNRLGETRDISDGEWAIVAPMQCSITPLSGSERQSVGQLVEDVSHVISTRYRGDIDASGQCRIIYGVRVFEVGAVINVGERNKELQFLCKEIK